MNEHEGAKPGVFQLFKAMAWAFLGIRSRKGYGEITNFSPIKLILVGVVCTVLLILGLLLAVRFALGGL